MLNISLLQFLFPDGNFNKIYRSYLNDVYFFSKTPLPTRKKLVRQQQFIEEQSFSVETAKRIYAFCAVDCMTHFCAISNPLQEELRCTIYCRYYHFSKVNNSHPNAH